MGREEPHTGANPQRDASGRAAIGTAARYSNPSAKMRSWAENSLVRPSASVTVATRAAGPGPARVSSRHVCTSGADDPFLPPLHGHPVKRFNIANRGGRNGNEEDRAKGTTDALQHGVQAAGFAAGREGRGARGSAGAGSGAGKLCARRSKAQQQEQNDEAQRLQQSELGRLRRELVRVEENAFLKKAAAYFAKQPK